MKRGLRAKLKNEGNKTEKMRLRQKRKIEKRERKRRL
jgi:hypothetical protein